MIVSQERLDLLKTPSKSHITEVESEQISTRGLVTKANSHKKLIHIQSQEKLIQRIQTDMKRIQEAEKEKLAHMVIKAKEREIKQTRQQNRDLNMERMRLVLKMEYSLKHYEPSEFMHEKKFRNELLSQIADRKNPLLNGSV